MKIAVFGLMKRSHYFQGLKTFFCCCLEEKETLFLRVFWEKANKNVLEFFGLKSWVTPLKNCDFWPYEKIPFLRSKNVSSLFKTWRNSFFKGILRKRKKKKMFWNFFVQNRGLPLWKIAIFGVMKKSHFCGPKMFLFCLEDEETLFLRVFWEKVTKKMFWNIFVQNRGLPLWKIAIFGLMKKSHFCGLKWFLFCVEHKETLF